MGKRSNFERIPRDYYPTPLNAVVPLIPHLPKKFSYVEPCAGDGRLVGHLGELTSGGASCVYASDIEPATEGIYKHGYDQLPPRGSLQYDYIITNPPWSRGILHPMIDYFSSLTKTWLLFDADWMHTRQAKESLTRCSKIVSVGRVKWIPDSKHTGKDNVCWYLFDKHKADTEIRFYGRM